MPIAPFLAVVLAASGVPSGQREWQRYQVICERLHLDKLAALSDYPGAMSTRRTRPMGRET